MTANHYATLGVAPHSPREVIRAAYLRLMRRYHPDKNPSPEAAARVRAITAAYAVLSVAEERAKYDERQRSRRAVPQPAPATERARLLRIAWPALTAACSAILAWVVERARLLWSVVPTLIAAGGAFRGLAAERAWRHRAARPALVAGGAATLALVAYAVPAWVVPEKRIERSSVGGKAMPSAALPTTYAAAAATASDAAVCSSEVTAQSITRELFRRAARIQGSNAAALQRISAYSLVRFVSPVVPTGFQEGAAASCKARVVLHLPLGVTASGGRQSVDGIVTYSIRGAGAGGAAASSLTAEPAFVKAIASLAETSSGAYGEVQPPTIAELLPTVMPPEIARGPQVAPTPRMAQTQAVASAPVARGARPKPEPQIAQQTPSFSCSGQKSWAEKTVCASANLAALDRAMSSLWGDAMARANARQRASLLASDRRFLASRAQCASEACVRSAYLVGTDDIQSIMYTAPVPQ